MSIEKIQQKDAEIKQAEQDYQKELARLEEERGIVTFRRDVLVSKLQTERDAIALEMKLRDFPAKLVKEHKTCSICGAQMRPFKITDADGKVVKLWACQAGNLSESHDLITVA